LIGMTNDHGSLTGRKTRDSNREVLRRKTAPPLLALILRTRDLLPINKALVLNTNPFDDGKLVAVFVTVGFDNWICLKRFS